MTATSTTAPLDAAQDRVADVVNVAAVLEMMRSDPSLRIIDVRTAGEFDGVHIPGSYNVPLDSLGEHARELAAVDHPVVLLCQTGARATRAHGTLTSAGKQHLHLLEGGMAAWQAAGGEVTHGEATKWALDRQVRFVAGSLSLVGLLASVAVPKAKWLAGGVASGLVFSAVTNTCAMGDVLMKLPYNRSDCDIERVLSEMQA